MWRLALLQTEELALARFLRNHRSAIRTEHDDASLPDKHASHLISHDLAEAREGEYDLTEEMLRMAESGRRMAARRAG